MKTHPISAEKLTPSQQNEIKEGIQQLNEGKRISYDDFMKKIYQ